MPFYGSIVVIKRSGADGSTFPLINEVRSCQSFLSIVFTEMIICCFRNVCWVGLRDATSGSSCPLSARSTPS